MFVLIYVILLEAMSSYSNFLYQAWDLFKQKEVVSPWTYL